MPIAITMFKGKGEEDELKAQERRANTIILILRMVFLAMSLGWFVATIITGSAEWRLGINIVFFYQTIVFVVSIFKIRSLISEVRTPIQFKPNHCLLILNLITFITEALTYGASFVFGILANNRQDDCRIQTAFSFFYDLIWLNILARITLTSYMNIKFSHPL